jgi:hypothetical protein
MIKDKAPKIRSEYDYITITNEFYSKNWTSESKEAQERYEEIWQELSYIYRANMSEEKMIDLLRTRSGIISVIAYSRTHWDKIVEFEKKINGIPTNCVDQRYDLFFRLRMYSINVPVSRSIKLTHRSVPIVRDYDDPKSSPRDYLIVEADYDPTLGLLVDL